MYLYGDDREKEEKRVKAMLQEKSKTKREKEIIEEIKLLNAEQEKIKGNKTLLCPHCKKRTQIKKLTVVDSHHYVRPYSCTGGDYWSFSNEYYVICPKCDSANRTYTGSYESNKPFDEIAPDDKDRITRHYFIKNYHSYFGEHLDIYESGSINSIDLDELRSEKKERQKRNW